MHSGEGLNTVTFVGNYLPRRCGIATFTTDLCEAVAREAPWVRCSAVVMNDVPEGYRYPDRVRFEVAQNRIADYRLVADFLNMNHVDIVCLQHEYGIFGGPAGSHLLVMLAELRMPVITTLHTVLKDPGDNERRVLLRLAEYSDRLVVMSERAVEFLQDLYAVPHEKIALLPHGIPDVPFIDPNYYKDQFGVEGRKVVLTFGLLSPGKGIENMIEALPEVVQRHPDIAYLVLGATHPAVKRESGEQYRLGLQRRAQQLGVAEHVIFHNRFVELEELCEFLGAADVYVTPYLNEAQITSGTLAYALGTGNAVVSTPYWYAQEMLADGRGTLVPFGDTQALAEAVNGYFDDEVHRHATRKRAYEYTRNMVWKAVARQYLDLFAQCREERRRKPRRAVRARPVRHTERDLPDLNLTHLRLLTDDTGILQHAHFTVPDRRHGYCCDDNARALIVALMARQLLPEDGQLDLLSARYLTFLEYAFNEDTGRFRNFMTYDRRWLEEEGSEDCHARSLWGLGYAVALSNKPGQTALALTLFDRALPALETFRSPRAWAFALVGIHAYLRRFSGDSEVRRIRELLAARLHAQFRDNGTDDWPWLEDVVAYANGKLPQALLLSGQWLQRGDMVDTGLQALEWLLRIQTASEGHFSPIGATGWYHRGGPRARFDQQPVEAEAMVEACIEAHHVTGEERWLEEAHRCFQWFLGRNDLGLPLYDDSTGGCRDGLQPERANQNEGAESTLAWLQSLCLLYLHAQERATTPAGEPTPRVAREESVEETTSRKEALVR